MSNQIRGSSASAACHPHYAPLRCSVRPYFRESSCHTPSVTLSQGISVEAFLFHFCYIFLTNLSPAFLLSTPSLGPCNSFSLPTLFISFLHFQLKLIPPFLLAYRSPLVSNFFFISQHVSSHSYVCLPYLHLILLRDPNFFHACLLVLF